MEFAIIFMEGVMMTKVDIYSGFLGAGKTTLIKKMIAEGYNGQKLVLIENEFGEIGIDGGFLQDAGINITEMNSGCICCSLVGDFGKALEKVIGEYHPDRIIIEPSGVGKLSDVIGAVNKVTGPDVTLGYTVAVVDAGKVKVYTKNFGEFYNNQVETASTIILSRTDSVPQAKLDTAVEMLRERNQVATIITTPWGQLTGQQLVEAMEGKASLAAELARMETQRLEEEEEHEHHHHHHDEEDDHDHEEHEHHHHHHDEDDCSCGHDHDHEEHEHHHHDHDEDEHCCCHHDHEDEDHDHEEHEHHHHEHDEHGHCCCHDHDADEVFTNWGMETPHPFSKSKLESILHEMAEGETYGTVIRCKGMLEDAENRGHWMYFDLVPGQTDVREGSPEFTGKVVVIGAHLDEEALKHAFCE